MVFEIGRKWKFFFLLRILEDLVFGIGRKLRNHYFFENAARSGV